VQRTITFVATQAKLARQVQRTEILIPPANSNECNIAVRCTLRFMALCGATNISRRCRWGRLLDARTAVRAYHGGIL
jgi:hypothetical protein